MMSTKLEEAGDNMMFCASCGIAGVDDIKLKKCTACNLVRYCSVKCQKDHRPKHKKDCKKRSAELRDEILFKQPDSSDLGDCPICCLPLPLDTKHVTMMGCCGQMICNGCDIENQRRELRESLESTCLFCRQSAPKNNEEIKINLKRRIEKNDPAGLRQMGTHCHKEGDCSSAFEYFSKAAALGDAGSHYILSFMYRDGQGVEMDKKKEIYHLEEAAIGGNAFARNNLGCIEKDNRRHERAMKHFIIAAKQGGDEALETLKGAYKKGLISKDDFAAALRGHQAAVDATKSPQRDSAEAFIQKWTQKVERNRYLLTHHFN